jgi:hypothetical protein
VEAEESKLGADPSTTPLVAGGGHARSTHGGTTTGKAIPENLRATVEYLVKKKGVHVCLCTLPLVGAPSSLRARAIGGVNARILAMAKGCVRSSLLVSFPRFARACGYVCLWVCVVMWTNGRNAEMDQMHHQRYRRTVQTKPKKTARHGPLISHTHPTPNICP